MFSSSTPLNFVRLVAGNVVGRQGSEVKKGLASVGSDQMAPALLPLHPHAARLSLSHTLRFPLAEEGENCGGKGKFERGNAADRHQARGETTKCCSSSLFLTSSSGKDGGNEQVQDPFILIRGGWLLGGASIIYLASTVLYSVYVDMDSPSAIFRGVFRWDLNTPLNTPLEKNHFRRVLSKFWQLLNTPPKIFHNRKDNIKQSLS